MNVLSIRVITYDQLGTGYVSVFCYMNVLSIRVITYDQLGTGYVSVFCYMNVLSIRVITCDQLGTGYVRVSLKSIHRDYYQCLWVSAVSCIGNKNCIMRASGEHNTLFFIPNT